MQFSELWLRSFVSPSLDSDQLGHLLTMAGLEVEEQDGVTAVAYSGLESSPWYDRARKYSPKGSGGVLAFTLAGGLRAGKAFVDALELHSLVANIGDVRSLVIHPASTTHSQLTPEQLKAAHLSEDLIRLSVGIEDVDDIIADLDQALANA